ncbi:MAG: aminomethyl transferase family protein [Deltaproteobacteria bacterium]|nr:aminomethyl transferase family protein [Deltaproteobacteria bacterium]
MSASIVEAVRAIRTSAAVARADWIQAVRLSGPDAFDVLDVTCSSDVFLRDGQVLHTLFLDESARPLADVLICRDDEAFFVLAEGLAATELADFLTSHAPVGASFAVDSLEATHSMASVDGPYAWELLGEVLGPDVGSLPYRTFFHVCGGICARLGKTGEFGYLLLLPKTTLSETHQRLLELGVRYDVAEASVEALDLCALENWFFSIRHPIPPGVTPIELQLQWRVSYRKPYAGSLALAERRARGTVSRATMLISRSELTRGAPVHLAGREIGSVYHSGRSEARGDFVSLALLEKPFACSGVSLYSAGLVGTPVRTISPPALDNRSLFVDPRRHTYHHRDDSRTPDLVPAGQRW